MFTNILHRFDCFDRPMEGAAAPFREKMTHLHKDAHWQNRWEARRGIGTSLHKQGKQKIIALPRGKRSSVKQKPEHIFTQQTEEEALVHATPSSSPRTGSKEPRCNPYVYFRFPKTHGRLRRRTSVTQGSHFSPHTRCSSRARELISINTKFQAKQSTGFCESDQMK